MQRKEHEHEDGNGRGKLTASTTAAAVTTITTTTSTAPTTTVAALNMPGKMPGTKCFTYMISFQPSNIPVQQAYNYPFFPSDRKLRFWVD